MATTKTAKAAGTKRQYVWKSIPAARPPVDAEVYGAVMERVARRNKGELTDAAMVEEARPLDSPIHAAFEWDDGKAAEAHRIDQAAYYRRLIVVVVTARANPKDRKPQRRVRVAYISVRNKAGKRVHRDAIKVMTAEDTRLEAIGDCLKLLMSIRRRFAHLSDLAALRRVFEAIDGAASEIGRAM